MLGKNISVIGSGSWGTALAQTIARKGIEVNLWCRNANYFKRAPHLENTKYHPGVPLSEHIRLLHSLRESCAQADILIYALPSYVAEDYFNKMKPWLKASCILVSTAKGIDGNSLQTISQIAGDIFGQAFLKNQFVCLSGPSFAYDVVRSLPTAITLGSHQLETAKEIQDIFFQSTFHAYITQDVIGVELGGSLKNVIAIACGFSDGLNFGASTRAALITRGLSEIIQIGQKMGAQPLTFSGLSGLGDLILSSTSDLSRNRQIGLLLAQKHSLRSAIKTLGQVAEGLRTTRSAHLLAKKFGVESIIIQEIFRSLYENKNPESVVKSILSAPPSLEIKLS